MTLGPEIGPLVVVAREKHVLSDQRQFHIKTSVIELGSTLRTSPYMWVHACVKIRFVRELLEAEQDKDTYAKEVAILPNEWSKHWG